MKIHAAIGEKEHIQVFDLDFGTLERFDELFELIHQSKNSVNGERFHAKHVNSLVAEPGTGTLPLFYNRNTISSGVSISELYDLTLQVVHQETDVQIVCSFRSMKWRKNKVESLLQLYFKLLSPMLE